MAEGRCDEASIERADLGSNDGIHVREADHPEENSEAPSEQQASYGEHEAGGSIVHSVAL